jgi:hypothetical protein
MARWRGHTPRSVWICEMLPWVTKVLRSAWMPAPPPESEPGLER